MALNAEQLRDMMAAARMPRVAIDEMVAAAAQAGAAAGAQHAQAGQAAHRPPEKKLTEFSSGDPIDWSIWRDNYEHKAALGQWNHDRCRRELASSMVGMAKLHVRNIPVGYGANAQPVGALLDLYQARFTPAAEGDLARAQFKDAKQREEESILTWHSRLRELFMRANPELDAAGIEANRDLRDVFLLGIANANVKEHSHRARPQTFQQCLETASDMTASEQVLRGTLVKKESGLSAMSKLECFFCKGEHLRRNCPLWKEAELHFSGKLSFHDGNWNKSSNSPRGRGGHPPSQTGGGYRNPRGRGNYRGRGRGRGQPYGPRANDKDKKDQQRVNSIGDEETGSWEEEREPGREESGN